MKNLGIIGCGDFLRWQADGIRDASNVMVAALYDPIVERAEKYAGQLGGKIMESADAVINNDDVDIVCLFVPPWVRKDLFKKAVEAGKHVLTTKPLGANIQDCREMLDLDMGSCKCGVIYRRTGYEAAETYKKIFDSGEIGKLALYKQDWLHHYPTWNKWATDPEKNGGPFMDAMIHNLNIARYLMARPVTKVNFFSDNHAHDLKCSDTEFMKLDFAENGSAHLFITWAADLAVYSNDGNDREHIDITYMITSEGWRLTEETRDGKRVIVASKHGETKTWDIEPIKGSIYARFADMLEGKQAWPSDLVTLNEACEDIEILLGE